MSYDSILSLLHLHTHTQKTPPNTHNITRINKLGIQASRTAKDSTYLPMIPSSDHLASPSKALLSEGKDLRQPSGWDDNACRHNQQLPHLLIIQCRLPINGLRQVYWSRSNVYNPPLNYGPAPLKIAPTRKFAEGVTTIGAFGKCSHDCQASVSHIPTLNTTTQTTNLKLSRK